MTVLQVSKLDNDPASMASSSGRAALPRAAPAATPFRAFKRADIGTSELTMDDLIAAGKYTGNEPGTSACRYPKMQVKTNCWTSTDHVAFTIDVAFTMPWAGLEFIYIQSKEVACIHQNLLQHRP